MQLRTKAHLNCFMRSPWTCVPSLCSLPSPARGACSSARVRIVRHTGNLVTTAQLRDLSAIATAGKEAVDSLVFECTAFFKAAHVSCQEYSMRKRFFYSVLAAHASGAVTGVAFTP